MKNRKQFAHRIDLWDEDGANLVEHLAGVEDFDVAVAPRAYAGRKPRSPCGRVRAWLIRAGDMLQGDARGERQKARAIRRVRVL
jgi:hypothetical protein